MEYCWAERKPGLSNRKWIIVVVDEAGWNIVGRRVSRALAIENGLLLLLMKLGGILLGGEKAGLEQSKMDYCCC